MKNNIKPGYMLKITTWENDADNYNTKTLTGLTVDQTRFYIEIAKLFGSCHGSKGTQFGNSDCTVYKSHEPIDTEWVGSKESYYHDDDNLLPLRVKQIVDRYRSNGWAIPENWDYLEDTEHAVTSPTATRSDFSNWYGDNLYDLIGVWCEGEYWRVFDKFEVFLVPDEIRNVTGSFKGS